MAYCNPKRAYERLIAVMFAPMNKENSIAIR
jgi:hypothetical protein